MENTTATAYAASLTANNERHYAYCFAHWIEAGVGVKCAQRHAAQYDCTVGRERTAEIRAAILKIFAAE